MTAREIERVFPTPTPPFDYTDKDIRENEFEYLKEQRDRCPVMHTDAFGGFWALTKFEDIASAAHDHEHFTTTDGPTIPSFGRPFLAKPLTSDPPEHGKYRKILQPYFTPAAVAEKEDLVREIVVDHVDSIRDRHEADLAYEVGYPVPAEIMAVTLGLDRARGEDISRMNQRSHTSAVTKDAETNAEVSKEALAFLREELGKRDANPTGDLLSAIMHAEVDGERLPDDVRYGMAQMLIVAGTDTTVSGITNTLALLARYPEHQDGLLTNPERLEAFINESLRYDAPVFGLARTVRTPVRVRGVEMEPGERVLLLWGSGNHDADKYDEPDEFVPGRKEAVNLTFGHGRHRCIGDHLAKLEIRVTVEEVLTRLGTIRLRDPDLPLPVRNDLEHGPSSLPVVW